MEHIFAISVAVFLFVAFRRTEALECYTCMADNRLSCNESEVVRECGKKSVCMTRHYSIILNEENHKILENVFESRCVGSDMPCSFHCRPEVVGEVQDCHSTCCARNMCNKAIQDVFIKKILLKKRSVQCYSEVKSKASETKMTFFFIGIVLLLNTSV